MQFLILTSTQFALPAIDILFRQSFLSELAFPERVSDDIVFLRIWAETMEVLPFMPGKTSGSFTYQ